MEELFLLPMLAPKYSWTRKVLQSLHWFVEYLLVERLYRWLKPLIEVTFWEMTPNSVYFYTTNGSHREPNGSHRADPELNQSKSMEIMENLAA